jgi:enamine deaminase RidA (YjgF/YER057c/UK114 family)
MKAWESLAVCMVFLALPGCAAQDGKALEDGNEDQQVLINPPGTEVIYDSWQFSQAVRSGRVVWISGQVGFDGANNLIPKSIEEQSRLALDNLKIVIEDAGGTLDDIVELVSYHTDMRELDAFTEVKAEFFGADYPAWTAVGVTALADPELKVEIRATAVIGSSPALGAPEKPALPSEAE